MAERAQGHNHLWCDPCLPGCPECADHPATAEPLTDEAREDGGVVQKWRLHVWESGAAKRRGLAREVSVSSLADRHAEDHCRAFAETRSTTVPADGDLREVVDAALAEVEFTAGGRFVIMVSEPYETEQGGTE